MLIANQIHNNMFNNYKSLTIAIKGKNSLVLKELFLFKVIDRVTLVNDIHPNKHDS